MSLVVVATGTGVGKTMASLLLAMRYRVPYWKPVASGGDTDNDTDSIRQLSDGYVTTWPSRYSYGPPVSPHLAGRLAGNPVELQKLTAAWRSRSHQAAIIEGIGGVLVPLNDRGDLFVDWMQELALPCVLVASTELGTINHTLLTLLALRARRIEVAGVVLNGPKNADNADAIERFGQVDLIDRIDWYDPLTPRSAAAAAERFDRRGVLRRYFTHAELS